ncbi:MAG: bifunctional (p)ppGpp synthetase/guanosine-3',5'-bis(diphosphate) 3'-pyrophosphohydrolase [Clostridia bacterium]|nr:bifunctional (p)ppGpp synthetase/guanosine-3',5'-bis(diphosphate) 3'-pyrophosphohydrolase [Clostridia bacterium]
MNYEEYLKKIKDILDKENIKYDEEELKRVVKYALDKYKDKTILDEPTMDFVLEIAGEVATLRLDDKSIYAAILSPIADFQDYDEKELKDVAGDETVELVTTLKQLEEEYRPEGKLEVATNPETLRNMFMALAKDIRVVIIKITERLSYMRRMKKLEKSVKEQIAKECLEIYAPISHRLGMSKVKSELEDISFRILLPDEYHKIKEQIDEKKEEREEYIAARIAEVKAKLDEDGIEATIYGRPKHFYSIYKKMKAKDCSADDLFDLIAIRVIVNSIKDCYNVLGIVHDMYKPMPGRFKDYIAVPKTNMYQSLHTTVFGEGGRPFEIQIRTWDMHNVAERGIAAHFSYKEKTKKISDADKKIIWLRKTLEIQKDLEDNTENLDKIKTEIFGEEVFVFTPKGEIKSMPKGSTPIDFAYAIHQKVAETMVGAKINGRMVPLNTQLKNKDVVEVVTSKTAKGPNRDWLKYVKTTSAKNKITSFLKKEGREINIASGKESFEKILKKQKYSRDELMKEEYLTPALRKYNCKTIEDCYENIGFGSISPVKVVNKIVEVYEEAQAPNEEKVVYLPKKRKTNSNDLVEVDGIDNCLVKFARCCSPIPGDDIVGYITFANGISIHRADCKNLKALDTGARTIGVKWKTLTNAAFTARIAVKANDRDGVLSDILKTMKDQKVEITEISTKVTEDRENITNMSANIKDVETLQSVIKALKKIDSVFDVRRLK